MELTIMRESDPQAKKADVLHKRASYDFIF